MIYFLFIFLLCRKFNQYLLYHHTFHASFLLYIIPIAVIFNIYVTLRNHYCQLHISIQKRNGKMIFYQNKNVIIRINELLFVTCQPDLYGVETWKE